MPHHVPPSIESILQLSGVSSQPSTATLTTLMDSGSPSGSPPPIPSPLPIDPNDNRPPGGTRRSGGTKTPRKVQWTDERDVVDSPRALDEHGLDVSTQASSPLHFPFMPNFLSVIRPSHVMSFGCRVAEWPPYRIAMSAS